MFNSIPQLKQITDTAALAQFGNTYSSFSGLPVPSSYLENNRVFAIYYKGDMIGGFILATGSDFRTINCFAKPTAHAELHEKMGNLATYTELCCFWIDVKYRSKTAVNMFIWMSMSYALKKYGTQYLLFGTCSKGLARLYSATEHSILIHKDRINRKHTFVFVAQRKHSIVGISQIVLHKVKRMLQMQVKRAFMNNLTPQSVAWNKKAA